MRQSRKPLTPEQQSGRADFTACATQGFAASLPDDRLKAAHAYLLSLLVLPTGGNTAKRAIKNELRRRKL